MRLFCILAIWQSNSASEKTFDEDVPIHSLLVEAALLIITDCKHTAAYSESGLTCKLFLRLLSSVKSSAISLVALLAITEGAAMHLHTRSEAFLAGHDSCLQASSAPRARSQAVTRIFCSDLIRTPMWRV